MSTRGRDLRAWIVLGLSWALLVAVFVVLVLAGASWTTLGVVAAVAFVGVAAGLIALDAKARLAILRDIMQGRPAPALDRVERLLSSRFLTARSRAPLLVCKAAALSLDGRWPEALDVLEAVDPGRLPRIGGPAQRLFLLATTFDCLVFSRKLARARKLFDEELEPLAARVGTVQAEVVADEARAQLAFLDGELAASRELFRGLLRRAGTPPAAWAYWHFFLACIAEEEGSRDEADRHFDRAVELGPETFLPGRVEALRSARRPV